MDSRPAMERLSAAVLAVAAHRSVRDVLQTIVSTARSLLDAEYAALGVPDDLGGFAEFVVDGVSDEQWAAIGPLPRQHGMLGVALSDPRPMRLPDLRSDPRFGWWPPAHPVLGAFLGVPVLAGSRAEVPSGSDSESPGDSGEPEILGAIYLANPRGRAEFSAGDERLARVLAAHAAIALENARLFEQGRELTLVQERQRMARELHDAVAQSLFSLRLTAQAAATLVRRDPDRAVAEMETVAALAADAADQLRQIVAELRPRDLSRAGLVETLRSRVALLNRVHAATVTFDASAFESAGDAGAPTPQGAVDAPTRQHDVVGAPDDRWPPRLTASVEEAILRVAEEALHNALRHASAGHVAVTLGATHDTVTLGITDNGTGFDTTGAANSANRLGLASMRERSRAVRGVLTIDSRPGRGATVTLAIPREPPNGHRHG